jgi:hypothetical protein
MMNVRDDNWLQYLLDEIWDKHFSEVDQNNIVRIEYGRKAKRRLGSIRLDPADMETSIITINRIFSQEEIPEYVVRATIVHELSHYAHGFNSPLEQKKSHPHAGGVMKREFAERGLLELYLKQKSWLRQNWPGVVASNFTPRTTPNRSQHKKRVQIPKPFWFI